MLLAYKGEPTIVFQLGVRVVVEVSEGVGQRRGAAARGGKRQEKPNK